MSVFPTAKDLAHGLDVVPTMIRAIIRSNRLGSRAGSYFKPVLVQVANALIKSKKS